MSTSDSARWSVLPESGILWDVAHDRHLPHEDEVEMSGRLVSLIARYGVDGAGHLTLSRRVVWPSLRTIPNNTHASLLQAYDMETTPAIKVNGTALSPEQPRRIVLDGTLTIESSTDQGIDVVRTLFPAVAHMAALEKWTLRNASPRPVVLGIAPLSLTHYARGTKGVYVLEVAHNAPAEVTLAPGQACAFGVVFSGRKCRVPAPPLHVAEEEAKRRRFVQGLARSLVFESPDPLLSRSFEFAKLRCTESIFATLNGLMMAPGGGEYYAAVWCNDQVEYANPLYPFIGDEGGNESAINTYRLFMPFMGPEYRAIPSSIVAEGIDIWENKGDRGDAAMYAYGASRFALALGSRALAEELWPAIAWCLEYCRRRMTPDGVIASDCDELERRFSCGKTNLATSALTYGGLRSATNLARSLDRPEAAAEYDRRADALAVSIDRFFGATIAGFETYRYHEGLDTLRAWTCVPLAMGILTRREGTVQALFSPELWTPDGLRTQAGETTFWDRSTLYGLRGAFMAGETETALRYFTAYSRRRLVGEHVPYPVEAYPEGGQRQLAAESALYCRVVTEGLFGITPIRLNAFTCVPRLPHGWDRMALRAVKAFGRDFDLCVERDGDKLLVRVREWGREAFRTVCAHGETITITLA